MINNVNLSLQIQKDAVDIQVDCKSKKKITIKNKTINTKDIYKLLDYNKTNKYILNCKKIDENELKGNENEIKRLYNYLYDLLDEIVDSVNVATSELNKK